MQIVSFWSRRGGGDKVAVDWGGVKINLALVVVVQ